MSTSSHHSASPHSASGVDSARADSTSAAASGVGSNGDSHAADLLGSVKIAFNCLEDAANDEQPQEPRRTRDLPPPARVKSSAAPRAERNPTHAAVRPAESLQQSRGDVPDPAVVSSPLESFSPVNGVRPVADAPVRRAVPPAAPPKLPKPEETLAPAAPLSARPLTNPSSQKARRGSVPAQGPAELKTNSDESIHAEVLAQLKQTGVRPLQKLAVEVQAGVVTLNGNVPTPEELLMALHVASRVPGVRHTRHHVNIVADAVVRTKWYEHVDRFFGRYWMQSIGAAALLLVGIVGWWLLSPSSGPPLTTYKVAGKVQFGEKPVSGGVVQLHPYRTGFDLKVAPRGSVKKDGSFTLSTFDQEDGAPEGEYIVTVVWNREIPSDDGEVMPGPNVLPEIYSQVQSSPLKVKIVAGESNELKPLALTGELKDDAQTKKESRGPARRMARPETDRKPAPSNLPKPSDNIPLEGE